MRTLNKRYKSNCYKIYFCQHFIKSIWLYCRVKSQESFRPLGEYLTAQKISWLGSYSSTGTFIEGYLWVAVVLGSRSRTEINLTRLGCKLLGDTHRCPKIFVYIIQFSFYFFFSISRHENDYELFLLLSISLCNHCNCMMGKPYISIFFENYLLNVVGYSSFLCFVITLESKLYWYWKA